MAPNISRVLTSPHVRAAQSAQALKDALPDAAVGILGALRPGGRPQEILDALGEMRGVEAAALVGHEPDLGRLAGLLAFGGDLALPLKKAGACAIRFEGDVRPGAGQILWLLPPKMLRRLAGRKERV